MDREWHRIMKNILTGGERRSDRTGVGTLALFGERARWDLREGFPACTTKHLGFGQVKAELAAFIQGAESLQEFNQLGCSLWDANAGAPEWKERQRYPGDVGRIYGSQWRRWRSWRPAGPMNNACSEADQLKKLVNGIASDPHGRRHVVTAWNPGELDMMCLPPCHVMFQCYASDEGATTERPRGSLDLEFHMRSLDVFLGMPFDVASYALLLHLIARETGRNVRHLLMKSGDTHLYMNHMEQVAKVLLHSPFDPPRLVLEGKSLFSFLPEDASLQGYVAHAAVPAPLNI